MIELGIGCLLIGIVLGFWFAGNRAAYWRDRYIEVEQRADYFEMWSTIYYRECRDLKNKMGECLEDGEGWKFR